jgi:crossover junction endodeoxyribonuclease RuvC
MIYLGFDPGHSGGFAVVDQDGKYVHAQKYGDLTERDIWDAVKVFTLGDNVGLVCCEAVHSMPKQGVASSFKFGASYGFLRGILAASSVPYEFVSPQKWQGKLKCRTAGDKNISKAAAQQRHPGHRITHATADALLIAEYARQMWRELND